MIPGRLREIFEAGNRRQALRVPGQISATIGDRPALVMDLGFGGCGFRARDLEAGVGQDLPVILHAGREDLVIPGRVVGQRREKAHFALTFLTLTPYLEDALERLLLALDRAQRHPTVISAP